MPLQVLPISGPADFYRFAVVERHAYDTYPSNKILFPGPFPPDVLVTRGKELQAQCEEPNTFCFKVVDEETKEDDEQQMIAFSKWSVVFSAPLLFFGGVFFFFFLEGETKKRSLVLSYLDDP